MLRKRYRTPDLANSSGKDNMWYFDPVSIFSQSSETSNLQFQLHCRDRSVQDSTVTQFVPNSNYVYLEHFIVSQGLV